MLGNLTKYVVSFPRQVSLTLTKSPVRKSNEEKLNGQQEKEPRRGKTRRHSSTETTVVDEGQTLRKIQFDGQSRANKTKQMHNKGIQLTMFLALNITQSLIECLFVAKQNTRSPFVFRCNWFWSPKTASVSLKKCLNVSKCSFGRTDGNFFYYAQNPICHSI